MQKYSHIFKENFFKKFIFIMCFCILFISQNAFAGVFETAFTLSAYKIAGPYFRIAIVACEPYLGIMIIGICENVNSFFGHPLDMQSTLAGNPVILTISIIMFTITKILKSNAGTKVFGMVSLGEIEKKLAVIFPLILGAINIYMIINYEGINSNEDLSNSSICLIIFTIILSILFVIVCYIIKTLVSCIEILQLSLSFIPGFSLACEIVQSLLVVFLLFLSSINQTICMIISIIIICISLILFKRCYSVVLYYRKIYLDAFLIKVGLKKYNSLIYSKKIFKKISSYFNCTNIKLIIPVFSLKRNLNFKRYESWYLVCINQDVFLFKDGFLKQNMHAYKINDYIFIEEKRRFIEFYSLFNTNEFLHLNIKPNKDMSFALSISYKQDYFNILNLLKFHKR